MCLRIAFVSDVRYAITGGCLTGLLTLGMDGQCTLAWPHFYVCVGDLWLRLVSGAAYTPPGRLNKFVLNHAAIILSLI